MSYILDALKKAEAEKDPDIRSGLAVEALQRRRHRLLMVFLLVALTANAALLTWLFLPGPEKEAGAPADHANVRLRSAEAQPVDRPAGAAAQTGAVRQSAVPGAGTEAPSAPPAAAPPAAATISPSQTSLPQASPPRSSPSEPLAESPPAGGPVDRRDLPPAQRLRFPDLEFSTHIYADAPDLRAVVVNGIRLTEGDRLGELELREITEEGAIFRFENRLVSVSVLEEWE